MAYKYKADNMGALGFCADDGMIEERLAVEGMAALGARTIRVTTAGATYEVRQDKPGDCVLHVRRLER